MKLSMRAFIILTIVFCASVTFAQTTEFTYQGSLRNGGSAANGDYDFQFLLFDDLKAGSQLGSTIIHNSVPVSTGIFAVKLDFGDQFPGTARYLEIRVRASGTAGMTILGPRQVVSSAPHSIRALNAGTATNATNAINAANAVNATNADTAANAANAAALGGLPPARYVQSDINGNVAIGVTPGTNSKLTVGGQIELTSGGIKFPNATTQNTAGITSVATTSSLTGNGTTGSPLGILSPLPIRDMDNPARQPINVVASSLPSTIYTVPAGKTLVIEFVSGYLTTSTSAALPFIYLGNGAATIRHYIPPETYEDAGNRLWIFSKATRIYMPAGQQLSVSYFGSILSATVQVSGYLVDVP